MVWGWFGDGFRDGLGVVLGWLGVDLGWLGDGAGVVSGWFWNGLGMVLGCMVWGCVFCCCLFYVVLCCCYAFSFVLFDVVVACVC